MRRFIHSMLLSSVIVVAGAMPAQSADSPRGMVAFFAGNACPAGWSTASYASGRLIVATEKGETVGVAVGNPLAPATPPAHTHSFSGELQIGGGKEGVLAVSGCCNDTTIRQGNYTVPPVPGTSSPSDGNLPYIQLTVCEKE